MEHNTAKHFVLQLGSVITLYLSVSFLLVLLFGIINLIIPDAADYYYVIEGASYSVRLGIAILVVFFPAYLFLTRLVNIARREEAVLEYTGLTKWLMYLSLLIGGGVILGDLVAIILAFLNGELTTRFILKAIVLLAIVGSAFFYYLQDARGYWLTHEQHSKVYGLVMALIVAASIVTGFFHTETPNAVRDMKLDAKQVQDLQQIQWYIQDQMLLGTSSLPTSLAKIGNGFELPQAPEDRPAYSYAVTNQGFKLCATFSRDSERADTPPVNVEFKSDQPIKNPDNWQYKAGSYCFERIVQ